MNLTPNLALKSHIDAAVLGAHAALARAAHSPREAIDILLDAMDDLEKGLDLLTVEEEADERVAAEVQVEIYTKKPAKPSKPRKAA